MDAEVTKLAVPGDKPAKITKWKVRQGSHISKGVLMALYKTEDQESDAPPLKIKAPNGGIVKKIFIKEGQLCQPGTDLLEIEPQSSNVCTHPTVMKDMCAECGADLRCELGLAGDRKEPVQASVAMVHCIPELIVSEEEALELGKEDENRLLKSRKLALLVDLDQTLIHTTNDTIPNKLKDVYHFQLWHGRKLLWYHTKFRPRTKEFLKTISEMYELHICTFGVRMYAHTIARFIDPDGKYFSHRILSRDECFDAMSKTANLKALFPCGDCMVAIIDDREDVWNYAPNLIHVKPYHFFQGTADINAPPGLTKTEHDDVPVKHEVRRSTSRESVDGDNKSTPTKDSNTEEKDSSKCSETLQNLKEVSQSSNNSLDSSAKSGASDVSNEKTEEMDQNSSEDSKSVDNVGKEPDDNSNDIEMDDDLKSDLNSNKANENDKNSDKKEQPKSMEIDSEMLDREKLNEKEPIKSQISEEEEEIEWVDEDDYLIYLTDILTRIHKAYYDFYDQMKDKDNMSELPNMKNVVPYVKRKVLKGVNIVFSGVVPLNMVPEKSRAYVLAKSLGANIQQNIVLPKDNSEEATTHLVASKSGTAKFRLAKKMKNIKIVNLEWLMCCSYRWEKVDERLFTVSEDPSMAVCDSPAPDLESLKKKMGKKHKKRKAEDDPDTVFLLEETQEASTSKRSKSEEDTLSPVEVKPTRFASSFDPLLSFSDEDIENMDKEVENLLDEDDEPSDEDDEERDLRIRKKVIIGVPEDSSTDDSLEGNFPKGWKKKSTVTLVPNEEENDDSEAPIPDEDSENELDKYQKNLEAFAPDSDKSESDKESIGSVDDEIADAVEKEFLSML